MTRLPAIFISHGMPGMALDPGPTGHFLAELPLRFRRPRAIVCVSAHLEGTLALVTADTRPATLHDFGGFSPALHAMAYPAPGDPALAGEVAALLRKAGFKAKRLADRGLDHGAWVPLSLMYPKADVPVVQLSVQTGEPPGYHLALGQALAPLRDDDVLIMGSGGATHDLAAMADRRRGDPPADYAEAFDNWLATTITTGATDTLLNYRQAAPEAGRNHPYPAEHFLPLLVAAGAGNGHATRLHRHFEYGVLSLAAYRWD
jgi:4,5-DOPA dioxygenase extradiol